MLGQRLDRDTAQPPDLADELELARIGAHIRRESKRTKTNLKPGLYGVETNRKRTESPFFDADQRALTPSSARSFAARAATASGGAAASACDVLVVGGGINGAGIARDLAGRGL